METNTKPDVITVSLVRDLAKANEEIARLRAEVRTLKGEDKKPARINF